LACCAALSREHGAGVAWRLVYGLAWWFWVAYVCYPCYLGNTGVDIAGASAALPSLIGHLVYGAAAAGVFLLLELETLNGCCSIHVWRHARRPRRRVATPAPLMLVAVVLASFCPVAEMIAQRPRVQLRNTSAVVRGRLARATPRSDAL